MEDVAPRLIEAVTEDFHNAYDKSGKIQNLLEKVKKGTATYAEAQEYSLEVSRLIGRAYEKNVSSAVLPDGRMYYNIAQRLIPSTLDENFALVSDYSTSVQKGLNEKAKIGLKPQSADKEQDRIDGIVDMVSNADVYDEVAEQLLSAVENFSQHVVDETIRKNVEFHHKVGLSPKIIRKAHGKCCAWCRQLVGEYDYLELYDRDDPREIYRRHSNCRCTVLYDPADGSKKMQNVHSKKWTKNSPGGKIKTEAKTGAQSGAKKTPGWEQRHADRYYEEIRNRAAYSDANKIASQLSDFTVDQIEDIRQHIFIREQPRSDGYFRFDSDYDIAQAWQRLTDGKNIRESDIMLLMHEYEELTIMRNTQCTYEEAHDRANSKYNWWEALMKEG